MRLYHNLRLARLGWIFLMLQEIKMGYIRLSEDPSLTRVWAGTNSVGTYKIYLFPIIGVTHSI
jgi:hypothetical protein